MQLAGSVHIVVEDMIFSLGNFEVLKNNLWTPLTHWYANIEEDISA